MKCFNYGKMGHMKLVCSFPQWQASRKEHYASSAPRRQPARRKPSDSDGTETKPTLGLLLPVADVGNCSTQLQENRTENSGN